MFVFAAMIEFAIILLTIRKFKARAPGGTKAGTNLMKVAPVTAGDDQTSKPIQIWRLNFTTNKDMENFCFRMDQAAIILFSTAFAIFNIVYAISYSV